MTMLQKVFYKTSERTLKCKKTFFAVIFLFSVYLKYEHGKGLHQVNFWIETQASTDE